LQGNCVVASIRRFGQVSAKHVMPQHRHYSGRTVGRRWYLLCHVRIITFFTPPVSRPITSSDEPPKVSDVVVVFRLSPGRYHRCKSYQLSSSDTRFARIHDHGLGIFGGEAFEQRTFQHSPRISTYDQPDLVQELKHSRENIPREDWETLASISKRKRRMRNSSPLSL